MQLVREGVCPECLNQHNPRNRRLLKKGIKRECSQGHLEIYGNPEYVAYYQIPEKKEDKVKNCRDCKDKIIDFDKKHDELICVNIDCDRCGMVLSGPPQQIGPRRWVNYPWGNRFDDATYDSHDAVDYGTFVPEW